LRSPICIPESRHSFSGGLQGCLAQKETFSSRQHCGHSVASPTRRLRRAVPFLLAERKV
jgi:hypothetical protein